jgi:predicted nucleic acid-binding protein
MPIKALRRLAELLANCEWDSDGWCLAGVLEHLAGRDRRFVMRFWRRNRERCEQQTPLWQAIGYTLVTGKKPAKACDWLWDWRDRKDVGMSAVCNFRLGFGRRPARRHWETIGLACRDALARLPHDRTAQFLAASLCESLVRQGRTQEFLAAAAAHEDLLRQTGERHWMAAFYAQMRMPHHLLNLFHLLQSTSAHEAANQFRLLRTLPRSPLLYGAGKRALKKWFGFWRRLHLRLGG